MRRVARVLLLLPFAWAAGCAQDGERIEADGPSLSARIDPDSAGLGDPVALQIEALLPAGSLVTFPGEGDSIGPWQILAAAPIEGRGDGPWRRWSREITVSGFRLGWLGPDSIRVLAVGAQGESLRLACPAPLLYVGGEIGETDSVDPSTARDIRDVVPTGPPVWPWIVGGAVLLLAAGLLLARRWRSKRKRVVEEAIAAGPSLEEEFEAAIASLLSSGLLEKGLYREFYYGVSRVARLYLERIHGLPLLESTSDEVARLLGPRISDGEGRSALQEWLREGDLVKYARMERLQAEAMAYLERSRGLVRRLPPPAAPEPESVPAGPPASATADSPGREVSP